MKHVYCLLLASCIIQASDSPYIASNENPGGHLEEIIVEPDDAYTIEFNTNPDGPEDYARHLAHILYGKECQKSAFCIDPFHKHLASLKNNHRNRYNEITSLIGQHQQKKRRGRNEAVQIPQILLSIGLQALANRNDEQSNTIQIHENTIAAHTEKITELAKSRGWFRNSTAATIAASVIQGIAVALLSYFLGTTPTGCPQPLLNASAGV